MLGVNELLGPGVLFAFVAGKYHQPRHEERALLFIDMRASTAAAEALGEARFLDLLNAFFADISDVIVDEGGEIHKYVGDEVIATWRLGAGKPPRCLEACAGAYRRLEARTEFYQAEFGLRPDFRAALHAGAVVVGELGSHKKEIALIGDAMNTAARLQDACRQTGVAMLASAAALERIAPAPAGARIRPLAALPLRGKEAPVEVVALERS